MSDRDPGYYADPALPGYACYWDGTEWAFETRVPVDALEPVPAVVGTTAGTHHGAAAGRAEEATLVTPAAGQAPPVAQAPRMGRSAVLMRRWVGGVGLLAACGLLGWAMADSGQRPAPVVPRLPLHSTPPLPAAPAASSPTPSPASSTPARPTAHKDRPASGHTRHHRPADSGREDGEVNQLINDGLNLGIEACRQAGYC